MLSISRGIPLKMSARILTFLSLLVVCSGKSFAAHMITPWPENKKGAVSLTFDDGYPSQFILGVPALDARGLKGSFYIITAWAGKPLSADRWNSWKNVANSGHEIGSHTVSHPYLTSLSPTQVENELAVSKATIDAQIISQKCLTVIYPYGDFNSDVVSITRNY